MNARRTSVHGPFGASLHTCNESVEVRLGGAWPITGSRQDQVHPKKLKLAMALLGANKHYGVAEIHRRHFNMTARQCGMGTDMEPIIVDVIGRTPSIIQTVGARLPKSFPEKIFNSVTTGLQNAADQLDAMGP